MANARENSTTAPPGAGRRWHITASALGEIINQAEKISDRVGLGGCPIAGESVWGRSRLGEDEDQGERESVREGAQERPSREC